MYTTSSRAGKLPRQRFFTGFLDPIDRLTQAIYTILIVMTFTMAYRATDTSSFDPVSTSHLVTRLALASFGSAFAWGIIDGTMFAMTSLFRRCEKNRVVRVIQSAPDEQTAIRSIARELDRTFEVIADDAGRRELYQRAYRRLREYQPKPVGFEREDFYGAVGVVFVTVLASLPLVIPLVLVREMTSLALRASNLMAIVMLFHLGHRWARYAGSHPIRTGSFLALLGLALVTIAIPLGG